MPLPALFRHRNFCPDPAAPFSEKVRCGATPSGGTACRPRQAQAPVCFSLNFFWIPFQKKDVRCCTSRYFPQIPPKPTGSGSRQTALLSARLRRRLSACRPDSAAALRRQTPPLLHHRGQSGVCLARRDAGRVAALLPALLSEKTDRCPFPLQDQPLAPPSDGCRRLAHRNQEPPETDGTGGMAAPGLVEGVVERPPRLLHPRNSRCLRRILHPRRAEGTGALRLIAGHRHHSGNRDAGPFGGGDGRLSRTLVYPPPARGSRFLPGQRGHVRLCRGGTTGGNGDFSLGIHPRGRRRGREESMALLPALPAEKRGAGSGLHRRPPG